jgi:hypothetical protein
VELFNETTFPSFLARAQLIYDDLLQAVVVMKATYDTLPTGETRLCETQLPLHLEDESTDFGTMETEIVPAKAWCDLAVLGHARSRSPKRPIKRMRVSLRIGKFTRSVLVTGDRVWERVLGRVRPSEPRPFTELPLTYARAYGGTARREAGDESVEAGYFANPHGRGFVVQRDDVVGKPLPNVEELDQPVRSWQDRPLPAGVAPLERSSVLRGQRGITVDLEKQLTRIDAAAFCSAHPRMCLPSYPHGESGELGGVSFDGTWRFRLPTFRYEIRIDLGGARYRLPLVPDTIYLRAEERRIVVVARSAFVYQLKPERRRTVRICSEAEPDHVVAREPEATPTTIRKAREANQPELPIRLPVSKAFPIPLDVFCANDPMVDFVETLPLCASG